jgi:proteasome lid subunit RPN8/RPN11
VAGRIEIEPQRAAVVLPQTVLHEICSHALEAVPEECCGLVLGKPSDAPHDRFRRVYRCRNVMDRMHQEDPTGFPRTNRDAFYIDPSELLRAAAEAEAAGEEVTAVYHSHVGARAYFSELDQAYASMPGFPFPAADHVVVSVLGRRIQGVGVFRSSSDGLTGFPVVEGPA